MDYIVEVRDYRDVLLDHFETEDSNTAYHEYRAMLDEYGDDPDVRVTLIEPEY